MQISMLFNQALTVYGKTSYNEYGREVLGSASIVRARIQQTSKRRLMPDNSILTTDAICYIAGDNVVYTDDKISFGGVDYKVFSVSKIVDGQGNIDHLKIEVFRWVST